MSAVSEFLARFPPFDALPAGDLGSIASRVEVRRYGLGENILVEDGEPAHHLYVVVEGSVELVHQEEVVEVLEPGECFGHPSLLTGMAPAFTVRGHEPSVVCYLIGSDEALAVLGGPSGAGYVATTLRKRLTLTGHVVHALPEMATIRVEELINRPPVFCHADDTIRLAAQIMTDNHSSAILVSRAGSARDRHRRDAAGAGRRRRRVAGCRESGMSQSRPSA